MNQLPQNPGVYQLVRQVNTEQNYKIVPILQQVRGEYDQLANDAIPGSSSSLGSVIQFEQLNQVHIRPTGVVGPRDSVLEYFHGLYPSFPAALFTQRGHKMEEGMYVFMPWLADEDVVMLHADGSPQVAIVFPWVSADAFEHASRSSPYCNIFRYMYELCGEIIMLYTKQYIQDFRPTVPFSLQQRGHFQELKVQGTTQQETDLKETEEGGVDITLGQQPAHGSIEWKMTGSTLVEVHRQPPGIQTRFGTCFVEVQAFKKWLADVLMQHSIDFDIAFWSSLIRPRRGNHLENMPEALLIKELNINVFQQLVNAQQQRSEQWKLVTSNVHMQHLVAQHQEQEQAVLAQTLQSYGAALFPELQLDGSPKSLEELRQKVADQRDDKSCCEACRLPFLQFGQRVPLVRECVPNERHMVCKACVAATALTTSEYGVKCPACKVLSDAAFVPCQPTTDNSTASEQQPVPELNALTAEQEKQRMQWSSNVVIRSCPGFTHEAIKSTAETAFAAIEDGLKQEAVYEVLEGARVQLTTQLQVASTQELMDWVRDQFQKERSLSEIIEAALPRKNLIVHIIIVWSQRDRQPRAKCCTDLVARVEELYEKMKEHKAGRDTWRKCLSDAMQQHVEKEQQELALRQKKCARNLENQLRTEAMIRTYKDWEQAVQDAIAAVKQQVQKGGPLKCTLRSVKHCTPGYDLHNRSQVPPKFFFEYLIQQECPADVRVRLHSILPVVPTAASSQGSSSWCASQYSSFAMPPSMRLMLSHALSGKRVLLVVVDETQGSTQVHVRPAQSGAAADAGQRFCVSQFKRTVHSVAFDDKGRFLLLVNTNESVAIVLQFDTTYKQLEQKIYIRFADQRVAAQEVFLVPGKKELLVVDKNRKVYLYDFASCHYKPTAQLALPGDVRQLMMTPEGSMMLAMRHDGTHDWCMNVYLLEQSGDKSPLTMMHEDARLSIFKGLSKDAKFSLQVIDTKVHFVCLETQLGQCCSTIVNITSHLSANVLCQDSDKQEDTEMMATTHATPANAMLDYLYYIFEKFPAKTATGLTPSPTRMVIMGDVTENDVAGVKALNGMVEYGKRLWKNLKKNTKKPFDGVELRWSEVEKEWSRVEDVEGGLWHAEPLGDWLKRAICLVPLQICRCENNSMIPLSDGLPLQLDPDVSGVEQVANSIHFGLYDAVFRSCKRPVWVVSSMGAQSTGKSFQLNHLGGSLFDVSGGRCTDGCWLAARETTIGLTDGTTTDVLLVMMDCEGLGSWERSETEDMLLSLYSAALSNLTMFKTHFDFNRYTSQTLQRFNIAAPKVKAMIGRSGKNVYNGKFMFALKDTQHSAVGDILREFRRKLESMVQESDNFVTSMYSGGVVLADFPYPEDDAFHERLELAAQQLAAPDLVHQFHSGIQFESLSRTLLAKICCKDWTPLDRNYIRGRVTLLAGNLDGVCWRGGLRQVDAEDVAALTDLDTQEEIPDTTLQFEVVEWMPEFASSHTVLHKLVPANTSLAPEPAGPAPSPSTSSTEHVAPSRYMATIKLPDLGITLATAGANNQLDSAAITGHISALRATFYTFFFPASSDRAQYQRWHLSFSSLLSAVVERRRQRAQEWLAVNMKYFCDDPEAQTLFQRHNFVMNELQQAFTMCGHRCGSCNLPCGMSRQHDGTHDCLTNHACTTVCDYCQKEGVITDGDIPSCKQPAGHSGLHNCGSAVHVCGRDCHLFQQAWNCNQRCSKDPGHEGQCDCGSGNHLCGAKCDLSGCEERCVVPFGQEHSRHECARKECPRVCQLCNLTCCKLDHFHDAEEGAVHLCGRRHACTDVATKQPKLCGSHGVCEIRPELRRETREFCGRRDRFAFEFRTQQAVKRLNCVKEIPPGMLLHDGPCCHSTANDVLHYCGHQCPTCEYMCTLPIGHMGPHDTVHGNMVKAVFVSDSTDIDLGLHKYARGESGIAESCDSFCAVSGRGHVHVVECVPQRCRSGLFDGHRHAEVAYTDGTAVGAAAPKDELTHAAYWNFVGFKDPCTREQAQEFGLCQAQCGSTVHDTEVDADGNAVHVYCKLPLWHDPVAPNSKPPGETTGYTSLNGHFFPCMHQGTDGCFSTYFIIDRSSSMNGTDVRPHCPTITHNEHFTSYVDNRLGTVYEAMATYIQIRSARCQGDLVSFIAFNTHAKAIFSHKHITSNSIISDMMNTRPKGGTTFTCGLAMAYDMLNAARSQTVDGRLRDRAKPVFILLTDSEDWHKDATAQMVSAMMAQEAGRGEDVLQLHCIGFGRGVDSRFMKRLADIGGGAFHNNPNTDDMARMDLVNAFQLLAEKPDRKSSLMVKSSCNKRQRTH